MMKMWLSNLNFFYPPAPVLLMSMCTLQSGGECMVLPPCWLRMPLSCFQEFKVEDVPSGKKYVYISESLHSPTRQRRLN